MNPPRNQVFTWLITGLVMLIVLGCAVRRAPSGGPPDKTPPSPVSLFPSPDSTNLANLAYLEIQFDEAIKRPTVQNQVWMLPEPPGGFEIQWKGSKKLRIILNDSLEKDQTYILTIGRGLTDLRNNKLDETIILPFSTGPVIDRGEISGQVLGKKLSDVLVAAYPLSDTTRVDSLLSRRPRYFTQPGKDGSYRFGYLRPGRYRLFAFEDRDHDRRYSLGRERIGFPAVEAVLDSLRPSISDFNFQLILEDTTAPKLVSARALHQHLVELSFNEAIRPDTAALFVISDSASGQPLPVLAWETSPESPARLRLYTEEMSESVYLGSAAQLSDTSGNLIDSSASVFRFTGSAKADTAVFRFLKVIPDSGAKQVRYDARISLVFSKPVRKESLHRGALLLRADTLDVPGKWSMIRPAQPVFVPDSLLEKGAVYLVRIDPDSLFSIYGESAGDTLIESRFSTWPWSELGEISGTVVTRNPDWRQCILQVREYQSGQVYRATAPANHPYLIEHLPEGKYQLRVWIDVNQNGKIDLGRSLPFEFAEPYLSYPDTVKVRKRWTTQGVNLNFK